MRAREAEALKNKQGAEAPKASEKKEEPEKQDIKKSESKKSALKKKDADIF